MITGATEGHIYRGKDGGHETEEPHLHLGEAELYLSSKKISRTTRTIGEFYGYSKCCIDQYLDRIKCNNGVIPANLDNLYRGTGFIPCESCASKPMREIVKDVDSRRLAKSTFTSLVKTATTLHRVW